MKKILDWWYTLSLPQRPPASSPKQREQLRYARFTAGLLLLIICALLPLLPIMFFLSDPGSSAPFIGIGMLSLLVISWLTGRLGRQKLAAVCIIASFFLVVTASLLTNPLDFSLVPLFSVFIIATILSGALLPPAAALITGLACCVDICAIGLLTLHTRTYNPGAPRRFQMVNIFTLVIATPAITNLVVAIIVYIIMRNLLVTIRRADQAEEIIALQTAIAEHERERMHEQRQLEEGLEKIAEAHARIANGDYQARVSLNDGNVLWSIAVPLNNLVNRLQYWKHDSDTLATTRQAAAYIATQLRVGFHSGQRRPLPLTGTPLDPVIVEVNKILAAAPLHLSPMNSKE